MFKKMIEAAVAAQVAKIRAEIQAESEKVMTSFREACISDLRKADQKIVGLKALVKLQGERLSDAVTVDDFEGILRDRFNYKDFDLVKADDLPDTDDLVTREDLPDMDDYVEKEDLDDKIKERLAETLRGLADAI